MPNFIGKFENLENDWKILQEKFDLGNLPHKTAKLVYKMYKKDFEAFGYENEYQKLLEYLKQKND